MNMLGQIVAAKRDEIAAAQCRLPLAACRAAAAAAPRDRRDFAAAIRAPGIRIIAEIKRASPSRGDIDTGLDPAAVARAYAAGGAAALSVLTEPAFFKGSAADLQAARRAVTLPVLRKDFIIDPYQLYETAALGADAVLLIVRILPDPLLGELHALACELGLDVLTEVYDDDDARRANAVGADLVGINNRNLASFDTDVDHAARLAAHIRPGACVVALSGIASADDIRRNQSAGITRFLVGETLVRAPDPAALLRSWTSTHAH
ncbi:MAG: indole-3-glycerol phosphate synthase TrpC [Lentisphaerota bacterium]